MRVVIADDHRLMLEALRTVLERDGEIEVVGETESGTAVVALVGRTRPDALLLDLRMPGVDGLTNLDRLARDCPEVAVIVVSGSDEQHVIREALRRGARSFVTKQIDPRDLGAAIRQVVHKTVHGSFEGDRAAADAAPSVLSNSQLRVLRALVRGLSNREIARELWLSEQTVKFHLSNIYRVLGVRSRGEAIRQAYEQSLVDASVDRVA